MKPLPQLPPRSFGYRHALSYASTYRECGRSLYQEVVDYAMSRTPRPADVSDPEVWRRYVDDLENAKLNAPRYIHAALAIAKAEMAEDIIRVTDEFRAAVALAAYRQASQDPDAEWPQGLDTEALYELALAKRKEYVRKRVIELRILSEYHYSAHATTKGLSDGEKSLLRAMIAMRKHEQALEERRKLVARTNWRKLKEINQQLIEEEVRNFEKLKVNYK